MNLIKELVPLINRPFNEKLLEAQGIIAHNMGRFRGQVVCTFSGGKDSLVETFLANAITPGVPVIFNNTGVEYPETVPYIKEIAERLNLNLIITKPIKTFWDCVDEFGFASGKGKGKRAHCCYYLKEKPMQEVIAQHGFKAMLTGITAVESRNRMFIARDYGMCYASKNWGIQRVHPILYWTEDEVRRYIADMDLPLNPIYAQGKDRCGCMPCTAYKKWEVQLRRANPKLYAYIKQHKDKQYVMGGIDE